MYIAPNPSRTVVPFFATLIAALGATHLLLAAGQPVSLWPSNIRYKDSGGVWHNTLVNIALEYETPPYDAITYTPTDWCGTRAHATKYPAPNGHKFVHIHSSFSLPKQGITDSMQVIDPVTTTMVDAAWDFMYDSKDYVSGNLINNVAGFGGTIDWVPYTQQGAVDFQMNCWGYAFGYNMWVQDPTYTWNYDYDQVTNCQLQAGDLIRIRNVIGSPPASDGTDTHVVKIASVCNDPYSGSSNCTKVNSTIEKNAASHFYLRGNLCSHSYLALFGKHRIYRKIP